MDQDKNLTEEQSLELIATMIAKARNDYQETGVSALFWGSIITFCSLVTFFNFYWEWKALNLIWFLTFVAIIPQVFISARERKIKRHKGHHDDLIGGIWISYAIAVSMMTFLAFMYTAYQLDPFFLILYGMPTFATGYGKRFRPMIIGGIACWVFAILCLFTPWPYQMLYNAAAAILAWFIPGLIFRKSYLKAKRQNV